ncbi:hypothetical protein NW752_005686 [Fusarium irregulare]|uniref:J domain-containing protein n=1 Tax=Fusarium irregulare TaxID=2494466 RepID=A0A9W8PQX3_9HYPO|nr:hypothetical protein NW766_006218 [Fusarium irregulare]KAJ4018567.1 hypothetical protein NW752_005686 [Fusarium irregulare]
MSTQTPDPYKILGVAKDAQLPEIRSAHRKLVLKCHPDKVQDPTLKAQKQDEFQRVQTAYELLADEKERKRYDDQARLAELREQMRAKAAASASSRQTSAAASPSSARPTPTTTYKYEIHTPERTYKATRGPSPGPRGYSSYSRSYEDDHPRAADIFEGVRTVRREKSYQEKTSTRREDREREEREREKEYAREMREREKEKERERQQKRRVEEAVRRAEKEAKEAAKEARRAEKEKKARDKSRKRETESKKTKPYIETDGEPVSKSDKKKSSKKHDERRERDRSTHREEIVPPPTSSMPPPPIPAQYQTAEYQSKADAAMSYIQASRSKGQSSFARHVQPPAPTPPPVGSPFAAPAEDDDARRSSAKPRRNSSGEKAYSKPEVVDDPVEATPPTARPHMHKSATATGVPTSSPPRRDLPRTSTLPTEGHSRYAPGIARAQTFSGAYPELDPRGRGRTRHQAQIPESDSEDEYERLRRERKAHRSSKKHRSPESRGEHVMQYRVDGGRTTLQNSYSRTTEPTDAYGYYANTPGVRVVERPSMPSRDASYSGSYGAQFSKVKTSSYGDVQFSEYPKYHEAYAA